MTTYGDLSFPCSAFSSDFNRDFGGNEVAYEVRVAGAESGGGVVGPGSPPQMIPYGTPFPESITDDRPGIVEVRFDSPPPESNSEWPSVGGSFGDDFNDDFDFGLTPTQENDEVASLSSGTYSVLVYFADSQTGLRSSAPVPFTVEGSGRLSLRILYDGVLWDTAYVYRTLKAIENIPNANLHLDQIIRLENFYTRRTGEGEVFDPDETDLRQALYYFEASDDELTFTQVYDESLQFDRRVPKAGAAINYEGAMILSNIRDGGSGGDLGEIRWSLLSRRAPELFPALSRWVPDPHSNTPIVWKEAGNNVIGLSRSMVFHGRRENLFLRLQTLHNGAGVANYRAATVVSQNVYFVDEYGLKAISSMGELDELRSVNHMIIKEWAGDHPYVSLAYDGTVNALFVFNEAKKDALVLWFGSSRATELQRLPFSLVADGFWPEQWDGTNFGDPLRQRAFFVQNAPVGPTAVSEFKPRVLLMDYQRRRKTPSGADRICMLPITGNSVVELTSSSAGSVLVSSAETVMPVNAEGAVARIVEGPANLLGKEYLLGAQLDDFRYLCAPIGDAPSGSFGVTTRAIIGSIPVRWTGHPVMLQNDEGEVFAQADFFRGKQFESLGLSFGFVAGDVAGDPAIAFYTAKVFAGDEEEPRIVARSLDNDGKTPRAMEAGEEVKYAAFGTHGLYAYSLTPSAEIHSVDLDFRLLGAIVPGKITGVYRTRR